MWKTAERSEEFSKPCENPRVGNPEQICKALNGFAQGGSFHSLFAFSRHFSPMGPEKAALFGIKRFE